MRLFRLWRISEEIYTQKSVFEHLTMFEGGLILREKGDQDSS